MRSDVIVISITCSKKLRRDVLEPVLPSNSGEAIATGSSSLVNSPRSIIKASPVSTKRDGISQNNLE
jgi:hypothetical protein